MQLAVRTGAGDPTARPVRISDMGMRTKLALVFAIVFAVGCAASTYRYLDGAIQMPGSLVDQR